MTELTETVTITPGQTMPVPEPGMETLPVWMIAAMLVAIWLALRATR